MTIDELVEQLKAFKAQGARTVQISDGYFGYDFNMRTLSVPNYSLPTELILRPINYRPDFDGITRETSGVLQESRPGEPLLSLGMDHQVGETITCQPNG
jgi:hypothetical protein